MLPGWKAGCSLGGAVAQQPQLSSSAKAEDPVLGEASAKYWRLWVLGPRLRGDDVNHGTIAVMAALPGFRS
jgi:hypothetical protein